MESYSDMIYSSDKQLNNSFLWLKINEVAHTVELGIPSLVGRRKFYEKKVDIRKQPKITFFVCPIKIKLKFQINPSSGTHDNCDKIQTDKQMMIRQDDSNIPTNSIFCFICPKYQTLINLLQIY